MNAWTEARSYRFDPAKRWRAAVLWTAVSVAALSSTALAFGLGASVVRSILCTAGGVVSVFALVYSQWLWRHAIRYRRLMLRVLDRRRRLATRIRERALTDRYWQSASVTKNVRSGQGKLGCRSASSTQVQQTATTEINCGGRLDASRRRTPRFAIAALAFATAVSPSAQVVGAHVMKDDAPHRSKTEY